MSKQTIGVAGEVLVVRALERRGFRVVGRNLRTRSGEIDILAVEDGAAHAVLHVIEVKTRRSARFGEIETTLTWKKLQKMKRTLYELQQKMDLPVMARVQFDFAALEVLPGKPARLQWFWNIGRDDFL